MLGTEQDIPGDGLDQTADVLDAGVTALTPTAALTIIERWREACLRDDGGLDPDLADDFRTTGLTHLLAVSGTNLTLVVGFVLILGRWLGVRGRWLHALAAAGIVPLEDPETSRKLILSTSEPGRNARIPLTITVRPPFTLPVTRPETMTPCSIAASRSCQAFRRLALSRESLVSP